MDAPSYAESRLVNSEPGPNPPHARACAAEASRILCRTLTARSGGLMKAVSGVLGVLVMGALAIVPAAAQKDQTWKGAISDSNCNGKHAAGEHDGKKMTATD